MPQPGHAEGPRGIIAYWRTRMQLLTSIIEQLRQKDCRNVLTILTATVAERARRSAVWLHENVLHRSAPLPAWTRERA